MNPDDRDRDRGTGMTGFDAGAVAVLHSRVHPRCVACGDDNPSGLHLKFRRIDGDAVEALFACADAYEGYSGRLHGGIIALLVDSAMTNCLFALGCAAVTAELTIRYGEPVLIHHPATIRARRLRTAHGLHYLEAEVIQQERSKVTATGTFMDGGG